MADEIQIYISPEDDVTTVRERLKNTPNRQVTLVIPVQTQLRSLVAWRVLHADARSMGKDVLVVSTDPQIRSLALAGKFRVSHSQASSITNKSRPPTRPGRTNATKGRLTSSQARMQATKKPPSVPLPPDADDESVADAVPAKNTTSRKDAMFNPWHDQQPQEQAAPSAQRNTEYPFEPNTTSNLREKRHFSSPLEQPQPGQIFDLHPENRSSMYRPSPDLQDDESTTGWADSTDYKQAEDIRNAAQYNDMSVPPLVVPQAPRTPQQEEQTPLASVYGGPYGTTPLPTQPTNGEDVPNDFYQMMDDQIPQSPLAEQHGSAYVNTPDSGEHDVHDSNGEPHDADIRDSNIRVEYLGDDPGSNVNLFDVPPISEDMSSHSWSEPLEEEQPESSGPSHRYKANAPRSSRRENRGNMPPAARIDDPAALPPIPDQPTVIMPPEEFAQRTRSTAHPAAKARSTPLAQPPETPAVEKRPNSKRASQQILVAPPRTPTGNVRPKTNVPQRAGTSAGQRRTPPPRAAAPTRKLPAQSSRRSSGIILGLVILLALAVGLIALFVPTADITLKLPAKDYSHAVTLKAVASGTQGNTTNTVPADSLSNNFEATGAGKATSSATVGTVPATGEVTFTNNANVLVTIPSGTIVTTNSGTAFSTQAEAVVNTASSNVGASIQVPIKAQAAGTSGNVAAGSINSIPPDSLNAIVTYNKMNSSDLKLTVTNEQATASGGVGNTPAIAQQDIDAVKASLHTTLQSQFNTWLTQKLAPGDQAGTLTTTETLENAPTIGQTTTDGTFTAKLKLSVTVLIVRAATIQRASIAQLNTFVRADKAFVGYTVVDDTKQPVQVQKLKTTSNRDATLTLAYIAAAKVVHALDVQHVRSLISGKNVKDARNTLMSIPGVQHVDISTGPTLNGWTPGWIAYWTGHITIHQIPEDTVTTPHR